MSQNYVVKSRSLRIFLQSKGFDCKVIVDKYNPKYDVFLFPNSELLQHYITEFNNLIK